MKALLITLSRDIDLINYFLRAFFFVHLIYIIFLFNCVSLFDSPEKSLCFREQKKNHFIIKPEIDDKMLLVIITMKTIKGSMKKKIIVSFDYLPKCYNWD